MIWKVTQEEASLHSIHTICLQAFSAMLLMSSHQQLNSWMEGANKFATGVC